MQEFHAAGIGGAGRDQPVEKVADFVNLADRDGDLIGNAEAGQSLFGIRRRRRINRRN
jgi:hypothetical protein